MLIGYQIVNFVHIFVQTEWQLKGFVISSLYIWWTERSENGQKSSSLIFTREIGNWVVDASLLPLFVGGDDEGGEEGVEDEAEDDEEVGQGELPAAQLPGRLQANGGEHPRVEGDNEGNGGQEADG